MLALRELLAAPPLNDAHDLLARFGFRFVWCTFPYFVAITVIEASRGNVISGHDKVLLFVMAVPIIGGLIDLSRLMGRRLLKRRHCS